ncbi:MAG: MCE family protein [Saprospiraceae bacterium]|nr:MCE family protein [Saprospiraceae bacterium]
MKSTEYQKIKLGIFVIAGVSIFIIFSYFIGNQSNIWGANKDVYAIFDNINGLKAGNNVRYSGMNSGTVTSISMISDSDVVVTISLHKNIMKFIKKDAKAVITSDGLVGNMVVNIIPGGQNSAYISNGDTLKSFTRTRTDEMLHTLSITNENAALLTSELLKISKEISSGGGIIHQMLSDPTMANDLKQTMHNLRDASSQSVSIIQNVNRHVLSLDNKNNLLSTIKDTSIASSMKNIISNVEKVSNNLESLVDNLNATINNANQTIGNFKSGQGAINYLSNDPTLVKKIDQTTIHLDSAILELHQAGVLLNQNLEALKHNWLLRGYFEKLEKDKLKAKDQKLKIK